MQVKDVYKPAAGPPTFRKYYNHAYAPVYDYNLHMMPQGRLTNGKLMYGVRNMKLMRSSKYGNTCRDCAAVLELAPGLYDRNYGKRNAKNVVVGLGKGKYRQSLLQSAAAKMPRFSSWWTMMLGTSYNNLYPGGVPSKLTLFNPDHMHGQNNPKYTKRKDKEFNGKKEGIPVDEPMA